MRLWMATGLSPPGNEQTFCSPNVEKQPVPIPVPARRGGFFPVPVPERGSGTRRGSVPETKGTAGWLPARCALTCAPPACPHASSPRPAPPTRPLDSSPRPTPPARPLTNSPRIAPPPCSAACPTVAADPLAPPRHAGSATPPAKNGRATWRRRASSGRGAGA